jgi:hypothetical protein
MAGMLVPRGHRPAPTSVVRREQQAAVTVYQEELDAWVTEEVDKRWTAAVIGTVRFAGDLEMEAADDMMARADGSPVKQEIAAQYIGLANTLNRGRIARTFRL